MIEPSPAIPAPERSRMHPERIGAPEPICRECGEGFKPRKAWQAFCNARCRRRWHGKREAAPAEWRDRLERLERRVAALELGMPKKEG